MTKKAKVGAGGTAPVDPVRDKLLAALNLIETGKDGDGFICREAMEQVREAIAQAGGAGK